MGLIDVDVVLSPKIWDGNIPNDAPKEVEEYIKGLYERIKNLPTVDIVYCKDCKYQEQFGDREEYWCKINEHWKRSQEFDEVVADTYWDADDFCSRGEKR